MAHAMTITHYLSPDGQPLTAGEQFRLLEIALRAMDPVAYATPGSAFYWTIVAMLHDAGYDPDAVRDQGGDLLQTWLLTQQRQVSSALYLLPGGATLYVEGDYEQIIAHCSAAVGGELPSVAVAAAFLTPPVQLTALAIREFSSLPADLERDELEQELTLVGFVALELAGTQT